MSTISASRRVAIRCRCSYATRSSGFNDGWLNDGGSFVVMENATYNCYSYQAREGAQNKDGALRFGPNEVEPDRYPISVWEDDLKRDPQNNLIRYSGTNVWFWARIFDPTTKQFKDVRVRGNLKWNGADYNVLATKTVGPGEGIPTWSLTKSRTTFTTDAEEVSHTARVGVEFEAEGGVFVKLSAGGGYEYSAGITREESRTCRGESRSRSAVVRRADLAV